MRSFAWVSLLLPFPLLLACGVSTGSDTAAELGTDSETESGDGDGDGDDGWAGHECDCTDAEICVADCNDGGPVMGDYFTSFRCVDSQACIELGAHTRECVEAACGSAYGWAQHCRPTLGVDLLCDYWLPKPCDEFREDCPDGEKCVVTINGEWPQLPSRCVFVDGTDAPGEPCTSFGDYADSCTAEAMCWSGQLESEPFEGLCQPFCDGSEEQPSCPEGLACVLIAPDFHLCI